MPARLLQLRQLLRALEEREYPRSIGENRQQLPAGFLQLRQLLRQQPKQQPGGDPEAGKLLPVGLVQLWQLLREEPLTDPAAIIRSGEDQSSSSAPPAGISLICFRPSLISNSSPGLRSSMAV